MEPDFFDNNEYLVEQNVQFLNFGNTYQISNGSGQHLGSIQQTKSNWLRFFRFFARRALWFQFHIIDNNAETQVIIRRGWSFFGYAPISVSNKEGKIIGYIHRNFTLVGYSFYIQNAERLKIALLEGSWLSWNFTIKREDTTIAIIDKEWTNLGKELFTNSDKYRVQLTEIIEIYSTEERTLLTCAALLVDILLKNQTGTK